MAHVPIPSSMERKCPPHPPPSNILQVPNVEKSGEAASPLLARSYLPVLGLRATVLSLILLKNRVSLHDPKRC